MKNWIQKFNKNWSNNLKYFSQMKEVGLLTSECLKVVEKEIKSGISTADIEDIVIKFQKEHKLNNSQYKFKGFPAHACVGKNDVVCHGIPSKSIIINDGDIVKVDVTFNLNGFHGDAAKTFPVGNIDSETKKLINVSKNALKIGIANATKKNTISDIGAAIESYVIGQKMSIVKDFTGHGILHEMHESPIIRHFWDPDAEEISIIPGMTFTIEPIICIKNPTFKTLSDKWTVITLDKSWCAQDEVTLGVTEEGVEIFTPYD